MSRYCLPMPFWLEKIRSYAGINVFNLAWWICLEQGNKLKFLSAGLREKLSNQHSGHPNAIHIACDVRSSHKASLLPSQIFWLIIMIWNCYVSCCTILLEGGYRCSVKQSNTSILVDWWNGYPSVKYWYVSWYMYFSICICVLLMWVCLCMCVGDGCGCGCGCVRAHSCVCVCVYVCVCVHVHVCLHRFGWPWMCICT